MREEALIKKICECLIEEAENITVDSKLDSIEGWDSIGRLMTVCMLSNIFNTEVNTATILNCKTINDIVDLIRNKLEG